MPLFRMTNALVSGILENDPGPHKAVLIEAADVSDGYHTMSELYEHRYALFAALVKAYDGIITPLGSTTVSCWKSRVHSDGTMFDGHFIVGMTKKYVDLSEKTVTYHLPILWWDRFRCVELIAAPPWDGHKSKDVVERLLQF